VISKTSQNHSYEWIGIFAAMMLEKQRLEHIDIWKMSIELSKHFFDIAGKLDNLHMQKFSEYMTDTCLCLSNAIADLSPLTPKEDIARSLTKAHLLTLEAENIIVILFEQQLVNTSERDSLITEIQTLDENIIEYKQQF
jgi:hypothetical protein